MIPFEVKDCALLIRMSGLPHAMNLRELRDRIAICSENVLYHHFCETTLRPTFDDPDYRNDFAVWSKLYLGDRVIQTRNNYKLGELGGVMNGAWGVQVRNADGLIVISDLMTGFWAFKMEGFDGWNGHQWGVPNVSSAQDWDNGPVPPRKPVS